MKFEIGDRVQVRSYKTGQLTIVDAEVTNDRDGSKITFIQTLGPWGRTHAVLTRCLEPYEDPQGSNPISQRLKDVLNHVFGDKAAEERKKFTLITNKS